MDEAYESKNIKIFKGLLGFLVLLGGFTFIFVILNYNSTEGRQDKDACNDFNPCTSDHLLTDDSCITPPRNRRNGYDCTAEDQCYLQSRRQYVDEPKQCLDGTCIADRKRCNGYCYNDTHCNTWPIPLNLDALDGVAEVDTFCYAQSCITLVIGGFTADCLSWIDTNALHQHPHDKNKYIAKCLYTRFDDFGGNFLPGVCYYRYLCAPFDYRAPVIPVSLPHGHKRAIEDGATPALGSLRMNFGPEPMSQALHDAIMGRVMAIVGRAANTTNTSG